MGTNCSKKSPPSAQNPLFMGLNGGAGPQIPPERQINLAANTLLAWTQVLSVFFLPVQGVFLLVLMRRTKFRTVVLWAGIQLLLLLP